MKIAIVAGSHRRDSESLRVAQYIQGVLGTIGVEQTYLLSLSENPLPLWDEGQKALKSVRDSGLIDLKRFPYGM